MSRPPNKKDIFPDTFSETCRRFKCRSKLHNQNYTHVQRQTLPSVPQASLLAKSIGAYNLGLCKMLSVVPFFLKKTPQQPRLANSFPESFQHRKKTFLPTPTTTRNMEKCYNALKVLQLNFLFSFERKMCNYGKSRSENPALFFPQSHIYNNTNSEEMKLKV